MFYRYRYTVTKFFCPYCGLKLGSTSFPYNPRKVRLGPEYMICRRCQNWYRSDCKEWPMLTPIEQYSYGQDWKFILPSIWFFFLCLLFWAWLDNAQIRYLPLLATFTVLEILSIPVILMVRTQNIKDSCARYTNLLAMHANAQQRAVKS